MSDWVCRGDVHTLPVNDLVDHDEARDCWCQPQLRAACPEDCDDGCWACGHNGMIDVEPDHDESVNVIHNAADGRE